MRIFMDELGFTLCRADGEVWMRAATDKNCNDYWEYLLLYVDDCLVISHSGEDVLINEIEVNFTLKESSIGPPDIYLGGKVNNVRVTSTDVYIN